MTIELAQLRAKALAWLALEPCAEDRRQIESWLAAGDASALARSFANQLNFGTAGLRGPMIPGPSGMNEAMVVRATWALADYLNCAGTPAGHLVVIGYDARPGSARFARAAAQVLSTHGVRVCLSETACPTPLIAFAVRHLGASAGIVITASHNPRGDNGYKLYDGQGVQIVAPWDREIAQRMDAFASTAPSSNAASGDAAPPDNVASGMDTPAALASDAELIATLDDEVVEAYLQHVSAVVTSHTAELPASSSDATVVYTPLHGVGFALTQRALQQCCPGVHLAAVPSQVEPDGTFPSVAFPNPEEKGALDEAIAHASSIAAEVVLAQDPDADRFSVALRGSDGQWEQLSGDTVGLLFAESCLVSALERGSACPVFVSTVVSSPALESLVESSAGKVERTLTGFKWLCRAALDAGQDFVFAYEEALGYCFASHQGRGLYDKDGIAALCVFTRLLRLHGGAAGVRGHLQQLWEKFGLWNSYPASVRFEAQGESSAAAQMSEWMKQVRAHAPDAPPGYRLQSVTDYAQSAASRPWYLGQQDLLAFDFVRDEAAPGLEHAPVQARVLLRPSGTEPKLKAYIHVRSDFETACASEIFAAQRALGQELAKCVLPRG